MTPSAIDALPTPLLPAESNLPASFRRDYFGDLYLFDWQQFSWRIPLICLFAIALCLAIGLAAGHPGAGLIAASGAMTVGFGATHSIDGSRFVPMIGAAVGMALSSAWWPGTRAMCCYSVARSGVSATVC
jgi:hypothetical protein